MFGHVQNNDNRGDSGFVRSFALHVTILFGAKSSGVTLEQELDSFDTNKSCSLRRLRQPHFLDRPNGGCEGAFLH